MAAALASFTVAVSHRSKTNGEWQDVNDGFFRCTAWRSVAENASRTLNADNFAARALLWVPGRDLRGAQNPGRITDEISGFPAFSWDAAPSSARSERATE